MAVILKLSSKRRTAKKTTKKPSRSLGQMNKWMDQNAGKIMVAAKRNTLRLAGKEVL